MFSPPFLSLVFVFNSINMPPLLICIVLVFMDYMQYWLSMESMMKRNHESQCRCNLLMRSGTLTLYGGEAMNPNEALLFKTNSWIMHDFWFG